MTGVRDGSRDIGTDASASCRRSYHRRTEGRAKETVMELYPWFKTLHVFFAIVAVGLNISYGIWQARAGTEAEHMGLALLGIKFLDDRVANPAYAGLLVVGIILVLIGPYEFTTLWIAVAIGLHIVMGIVAIAFYSPTLKRQ